MAMSFVHPADDPLMRGLSDLKTGALFSLLVNVLVFLTMLTLLVMMPHMAMLETGPGMVSATGIVALLGALSLIVVMGIALLVLAILALYKFYRATGYLREYDPKRLGIGRTGIVLSLAGLGVVVIGILILALSIPASSELGVAWPIFAFLGLVIVAAVLIIVGSILFGVMVMRLGEVEVLDPGFRWAGILYVAGIILGLIPGLGIVGAILGLVSTILIYIYSKSSLETLKGGGGEMDRAS